MLECPRGCQRFFLDLCIMGLNFCHRPTGVCYRFESSVLLMLSNYGSEPIATRVCRYDSFLQCVVQCECFVGRQLVFQLVEGLLLWRVPYPFVFLFKQVLNWFGHFGTSFACLRCREIALRRGRRSVQVSL